MAPTINHIIMQLLSLIFQQKRKSQTLSVCNVPVCTVYPISCSSKMPRHQSSCVSCGYHRTNKPSNAKAIKNSNPSSLITIMHAYKPPSSNPFPKPQPRRPPPQQPPTPTTSPRAFTSQSVGTPAPRPLHHFLLLRQN